MRSRDEGKIIQAREYLEGKGIPTYAKNMYSQGLICAQRPLELGDPSLHVVHPRDVRRARLVLERANFVT
jgi:hypothetical protein